MALLPGVHKLRKFLDSNEIPQLQLAKALGVTHVTVLNWIRGRATPTPPFRKAIAIWTKGEVIEADWESKKERELAEAVAAVKPFEPPPAEPSDPEPQAGAAE